MGEVHAAIALLILTAWFAVLCFLIWEDRPPGTWANPATAPELLAWVAGMLIMGAWLVLIARTLV